MKLVALERTHSPPLPGTMTYDNWMQHNHAIDSCLEVRHVDWLCSLVSSTGDRSICLFDAPYAESLREACRQARMPFQRVWTAERASAKVPPFPQCFPQHATLIIVESHYNAPITPEDDQATQQQMQADLEELNIQRVSVLALDRTHAVGLFATANVEEVRSLYRRAKIPVQYIWQGTLIQPIS
ncbi:nickel-binding protein [Egbenema bharatensis]|uniref:nickel-binding protein n=1 Tax=Egbenema bharatensis TaxID=3463334 RepID=UPI003A89FE53